MSAFTDGMDSANVAFGVVCGETFTLVRGGIPGNYLAVSIDDMVTAQAVAPGGFRGDNKANVFISRAVFAVSGIVDGSVLIVRGKRLRVSDITDEADNTMMLSCASAGVKL